MDTELDDALPMDPEAAASAEPAETDDGAGPVILADAMCGAFCSIKSDPRVD